MLFYRVFCIQTCLLEARNVFNKNSIATEKVFEVIFFQKVFSYDFLIQDTLRTCWELLPEELTIFYVADPSRTLNDSLLLAQLHA